MKKYLRAVKHFFIRQFKAVKRIGLRNKSFTIISNNCTGGYVYQHFGIEYHSPTAGLFFQTEDFVSLCETAENFFKGELTFISHEDSIHGEMLAQLDNKTFPIGRIDGKEIFFLHYSTEEEAAKKWTRRCRRINYDNMIFLLTENESTTEELLRDFCKLPCSNKLCFTYNKYNIEGTLYSEEVHNMEKHSWKPEIVMSMIDWKEYLNGVK